MSGGHWNYSAGKYEDGARLASGALLLLAAIEHELDWGHSYDSCLACARMRVADGLDLFFDDGGDPTNAVRAMRDRDAVKNYCDACIDRMPSWIRRADARPTIEERNAEVARRKAK